MRETENEFYDRISVTPEDEFGSWRTYDVDAMSDEQFRNLMNADSHWTRESDYQVATWGPAGGDVHLIVEQDFAGRTFRLLEWNAELAKNRGIDNCFTGPQLDGGTDWREAFRQAEARYLEKRAEAMAPKKSLATDQAAVWSISVITDTGELSKHSVGRDLSSSIADIKKDIRQRVRAGDMTQDEALHAMEVVVQKSDAFEVHVEIGPTA